MIDTSYKSVNIPAGDTDRVSPCAPNTTQGPASAPKLPPNPGIPPLPPKSLSDSQASNPMANILPPNQVPCGPTFTHQVAQINTAGLKDLEVPSKIEETVNRQIISVSAKISNGTPIHDILNDMGAIIVILYDLELNSDDSVGLIQKYFIRQAISFLTTEQREQVLHGLEDSKFQNTIKMLRSSAKTWSNDYQEGSNRYGQIGATFMEYICSFGDDLHAEFAEAVRGKGQTECQPAGSQLDEEEDINLTENSDFLECQDAIQQLETNIFCHFGQVYNNDPAVMDAVRAITGNGGSYFLSAGSYLLKSFSDFNKRAMTPLDKSEFLFEVAGKLGDCLTSSGFEKATEILSAHFDILSSGDRDDLKQLHSLLHKLSLEPQLLSAQATPAERVMVLEAAKLLVSLNKRGLSNLFSQQLATKIQNLDPGNFDEIIKFFKADIATLENLVGENISLTDTTSSMLVDEYLDIYIKKAYLSQKASYEDEENIDDVKIIMDTCLKYYGRDPRLLFAFAAKIEDVLSRNVDIHTNSHVTFTILDKLPPDIRDTIIKLTPKLNAPHHYIGFKINSRQELRKSIITDFNKNTSFEHPPFTKLELLLNHIKNFFRSILDLEIIPLPIGLRQEVVVDRVRQYAQKRAFKLCQLQDCGLLNKQTIELCFNEAVYKQYRGTLSHFDFHPDIITAILDECNKFRKSQIGQKALSPQTPLIRPLKNHPDDAPSAVLEMLGVLSTGIADPSDLTQALSYLVNFCKDGNLTELVTEGLSHLEDRQKTNLYEMLNTPAVREIIGKTISLGSFAVFDNDNDEDLYSKYGLSVSKAMRDCCHTELKEQIYFQAKLMQDFYTALQTAIPDPKSSKKLPPIEVMDDQQFTDNMLHDIVWSVVENKDQQIRSLFRNISKEGTFSKTSYQQLLSILGETPDSASLPKASHFDFWMLIADRQFGRRLQTYADGTIDNYGPSAQKILLSFIANVHNSEFVDSLKKNGIYYGLVKTAHLYEN